MSRDRGSHNGLGRRRFLKLTGTAAAGAVLSPFVGRIDAAHAAWPADRPVKIIVANSPGGPSDLSARMISPALQEALGGTFIVENRPGGGGNIGMQAAIRSDPDGYTLHLATSLWAIAPNLASPPPHDPLKDMLPIVELAASPTVFVVRADSGVKTMKELAELARKDQSKFNISTPPIGTTLHLGAELFKHREKLDKIAVLPHTGGGQAIQALLSNTVQVCSSSFAPAIPHIEGGTLRAIGVLGDARLPELPDVPTAEEQGYKDFNFDTYVALMAPVKTPVDIIKKIESASLKAMATPELKEKFTKAGFVVKPKNAEEHAARLRREVPLFRSVIESANIKPPGK